MVNIGNVRSSTRINSPRIGLALLLSIAIVLIGSSGRFRNTTNPESATAAATTTTTTTAEGVHNTEDHTMNRASNLQSVRYEIIPPSEEKDPSFRKKHTIYKAVSPNNEALSVHEWATFMASHPQNSESLTQIIRDSPYSGLFFETKGVNSSSVQTKQFEFALVESKRLKEFAESRPDPDAFAQHFARICATGGAAEEPGRAFSNLSGDAALVAPTPPKESSADLKAFSHLAAFVRAAPPEQVGQLWQMVAKEYLDLLQQSPGQTVWFSTSGLGVAWLHFRLDTYPKYYTYRPFANEN